MFEIIEENFRVLCTDIQNSKQDTGSGKPDGCAEIHAVIYYFILLTGECHGLPCLEVISIKKHVDHFT